MPIEEVVVLSNTSQSITCKAQATLIATQHRNSPNLLILLPPFTIFSSINISYPEFIFFH